MPVSPTYPGVYIEEVPSIVRTITGVPTSITAFIGSARRGPTDDPIRITSWADFQRIFGGLWRPSPMTYAVYQYYQNGGSEAVIVRIQNGGAAATIDLGGGVTLRAKSPGAWGDRLRARVDYNTRDPNDATLYNLTLRDTATGNEERFLNVSTDPNSARSLDKVLRASSLAESTGALDARPAKHDDVPRGKDPFADPPAAAGGGAAPGGGGAAPGGGGAAPGGGGAAPGGGGGAAAAANNFAQATGGTTGDPLTDAQYTGDADAKTGFYALLKTDIFNLLCIPPRTREDDGDVSVDTLALAAQFCLEQRAMLLVDAPTAWNNLQAAVDGRDAVVTAFGDAARNAAIYFPRIRLADPEQDGLLSDFAPSGAIAGVFARTDAQRGVWKAPAGIDASLNGVRELTVKLADLENGQLNPVGVNCLRTFPVIGPVVWGARTLRGADQLASEWKYVPVRRLALFLEESLYRGTQWVVFEPNDEPLWAAIRLNVGAFMQTLFRQGAFQGRTAREAYLVKCDKETTTQNDIDRGIVNIVVGFAPLKPAEFVIIKIQQLAGQIQV